MPAASLVLVVMTRHKQEMCAGYVRQVVDDCIFSLFMRNKFDVQYSFIASSPGYNALPATPSDIVKSTLRVWSHLRHCIAVSILAHLNFRTTF